jgi:hypothetical protein
MFGSFESAGRCELHFHLESGKHQLPVRYGNCGTPEALREIEGPRTANQLDGQGIDVTLEGQLLPDGTFDARTITASDTRK